MATCPFCNPEVDGANETGISQEANRASASEQTGSAIENGVSVTAPVTWSGLLPLLVTVIAMLRPRSRWGSFRKPAGMD